MLDWSPTAAFFLFAALVQLVFGVVIIVRRPRSEPAWVLGALFLLNAADDVCAALIHLSGFDPWTTGWARRSRYYFDKTSTYTIAYLALCYPHRPTWLVSVARSAQRPSAGTLPSFLLAHRGWLLPVLVYAPLAVFLGMAAVDGTHLFGSKPGSLNYDGEKVPWGLLSQVVVPSVPFTILLVRWSVILLRERSPVLQRQFRLVFAAFGVRAVHVALQFGIGHLVVYDPIWSAAEGTWGVVWAGARLVQLAGVLAAVGYLFAQRGRVPTDVRRSIDFVLAFLFLGALEVFPLETALHRSVIQNPLTHLDVAILRPVLLYFAIVRYDIIGLRFRSAGLGVAILAAVALPAFFVGLLPMFTVLLGDGAARLVGAAVGAAGLTAVVVLLLIPYLRAQRETGHVAPRVEEYVAALEDLHRNGDATPESMARLEPLRRSLGITGDQADALREAVASRWSSGKGDWRPGTRVRGRYEVIRLMGEGAHAWTYLARDLLAEQDVVLKRLRHLDEPGKRALLHEAYQLSRLDHPNVVRCLRTEHLDGEPILVLEHLTGGSLATRLAQRGRLGAAESCRIGGDVLAGLGAAHALGVVHRDVKPSNILFDGDGRAKLCDFGIARAAPASRAGLGDPTPTSGGGGTGTLRYLSPEQVRGLAATERSDLYAAGVVLYEAATGEHPVPADLPDFEMRRRIVEGPVPVMPRDLPEPLRRVLRSLLDKDPARRPAGAVAAGKALRLLP